MSQSSLRSKIEKKLQCVAQKEVELSNEYFQIPRNAKEIQYFISCVSHAVINGLYFEQLWCSYIICVRQSKKS